MNKLNVSKFSAVGFIAILILLHFLKPEINPIWQPPSEYALGKFGWLMNIAFVLFGFTFAFLGLFLIQKLPKVGAKIGGILLILASIGNFLAGFFNTDPTTTSHENLTTSGQIHSGAAGLLGLMILATIFITVQFYKNNALKPYKKSMLMITIILWTAELSLIGSMGFYLSKTNGMITEETPISWLARVVLILCSIWCWICADKLSKASSYYEKN